VVSYGASGQWIAPVDPVDPFTSTLGRIGNPIDRSRVRYNM